QPAAAPLPGDQIDAAGEIDGGHGGDAHRGVVQIDEHAGSCGRRHEATLNPIFFVAVTRDAGRPAHEPVRPVKGGRGSVVRLVVVVVVRCVVDGKGSVDHGAAVASKDPAPDAGLVVRGVVDV